MWGRNPDSLEAVGAVAPAFIAVRPPSTGCTTGERTEQRHGRCWRMRSLSRCRSTRRAARRPTATARCSRWLKVTNRGPHPIYRATISSEVWAAYLWQRARLRGDLLVPRLLVVRPLDGPGGAAGAMGASTITARTRQSSLCDRGVPLGRKRRTATPQDHVARVGGWHWSAAAAGVDLGVRHANSSVVARRGCSSTGVLPDQPHPVRDGRLSPRSSRDRPGSEVRCSHRSPSSGAVPEP